MPQPNPIRESNLPGITIGDVPTTGGVPSKQTGAVTGTDGQLGGPNGTPLELPPSVANGNSSGGATLPLASVPGIVSALNVRDFGAKGDGIADDTTALNAALNAAWAASAIGVAPMVYLPRGLYRVTSALYSYPYVQIVGQGQMFSRLVPDPAGNFTNGPLNAAPFVLKYNGGDAFWHGGALRNFGIDLQNIAGLGGIWFQSPGENSIIDMVRVNNSGSTARTVADVVTNATTTVTSATAAFTADDVNAIVTGTRIPANTKIDQVVSATQVTLNNAATSSGSGGTLTINRPADAVVLDGTGGGPATGMIGSLNGSSNQGATLRLNNQNGGSWSIASLTGDNNGGGLLRISNASASADPTSITVLNMKAENNVYASRVVAMDPVVLIDNSDMVALNILGGSFVNSYTPGRDVVRIDQKVTNRGGPSVYLGGIEGANPFNTQYANIIRDSATGEAIVSTPLTSGYTTTRRLYPNIIWGRDLLIGGGASIPAIQPWHHILPFFSDPDVAYNGAAWQLAQSSAAFLGFGLYNVSNAQNDGAAWKVTLARGTWRLNLMALEAATGAIATIDISFDGGATWTAIGTADTYGAGANRFVFPGIVVPTDGPALVRFRALTRNASATAWYLTLSGMEWTRTA